AGRTPCDLGPLAKATSEPRSRDGGIFARRRFQDGLDLGEVRLDLSARRLSQKGRGETKFSARLNLGREGKLASVGRLLDGAAMHDREWLRAPVAQHSSGFIVRDFDPHGEARTKERRDLPKLGADPKRSRRKLLGFDDQRPPDRIVVRV